MDSFTDTFTVDNMDLDIKTEHHEHSEHPEYPHLPTGIPASYSVPSNNCQAMLKDGRQCSRVFCMSYNNQLFCKTHYNVMKKKEVKDDACAVCLESMQKGPIMTLGCGHNFHKRCLTLWCHQNKDSCPLCRTQLDVNSLLKVNSDVMQQIGQTIFSLPAEQRAIMLQNVENTLVSTMSSFYSQTPVTPAHVPLPTTAAAHLSTEEQTPGPQPIQLIHVFEERVPGPARDPRLRQRDPNIRYNVYPFQLEEDEEEYE